MMTAALAALDEFTEGIQQAERRWRETVESTNRAEDIRGAWPENIDFMVTIPFMSARASSSAWREEILRMWKRQEGKEWE